MTKDQLDLLKLDAKRYRYLRNENNWRKGIGEATDCVFDEIVDSIMLRSSRNLEQTVIDNNK
jgi:hypothetical protein